ncbi:glycoprotein H [Psittacid alphaherpesvirus 1]|uniref:Envelope glycoprotein H n=1 Tax=Psittacid herpesvirus 1 (isolate Amazon parrot/-/97-0001/1997) TaxID=670426 RepID=GH_PSHV1|nr:envelope glycoprotein H [Psittacid alphaherpesvirus 1]Q6UDL0.1 RecName: Full=Envelope glycoprotein H; Short=gH; Flags: Precursor [Psittacid herpesvirus 1 Amazon parrot/1997]AAQ73700.1 glycoprotein H [Psittacid alphaherpesvirus 1]
MVTPRSAVPAARPLAARRLASVAWACAALLALVALQCATATKDIVTMHATRNSLIPKDTLTVAVVMIDSYDNRLVFHANKNLLFGASNTSARALAEAYNLLGEVYVTYAYYRWARDDRPVAVGRPAPDYVLGTRLLSGPGSQKIKPPEERPSFPLSGSLRGKSLLMPRKVIFNDPLQTLMPFVFTRYLSITLSGYWDISVNSGKNVFSLCVSSPATPPVEVIATPRSAKLRESRFPQWPRYLYVSSSETSVLVNVAAGTSYKPRLYNATLAGVKAFLEVQNYGSHVAAGQLLTIKQLLKHGCNREPDEPFVVAAALHFGAAWHRFAALAAETYVTDAEILEFVVTTETWAKQVELCFSANAPQLGAAPPASRLAILSGRGGADEGLINVPYAILQVSRERYWGEVRSVNEQLTILTAILGSVDRLGAAAYLPSADGVAPHAFAASIIDSYYHKLIRGSATDKIDRKTLSAAVRVFLARKADSIPTARRVLTHMTVLCSEHQAQNPLVDITGTIDAASGHGEIFCLDDLFTPCAAALRFDLEPQANRPSGNVISASAVYRTLYGSFLYGGSELETAALLDDSARVIAAAQPVGGPKAYADMFFPELARCFDWTRENSIVFYIAISDSASWILTTRPVTGGVRYRLPDTSIRTNLYLTYFNASCSKEPFASRVEKITSGYVNLHGASIACKLCGHALLRYSLGGFEDVFVIRTADEERQMTMGANSSIQYFRAMDPTYFNYILMDSSGSALRVLAFTHGSYAVDKNYIIGIAVGSLAGVFAVAFAARSIYKFYRGRANRYTLLTNDYD